MEGNIPLDSMVLAKYRLLWQYLEGKLSTVTEAELKNMINTMLKKINTSSTRLLLAMPSVSPAHHDLHKHVTRLHNLSSALYLVSPFSFT
jgi:hypothetical protein